MHIFIIAAMSIDGFIARNDDEPSTTWTSKEDSRWFHQKTKEAGVVVMGRTSYETIPQDYRPLTDRLNVVYSSKAAEPVEMVSPTEWRTTLAPEALVEHLVAKGHDTIAICGGQRVYSDWMRSGLVDTLFLTVEPLIFGSGTKLFDSSTTAELELKHVHALSPQTNVLECRIT